MSLGKETQTLSINLLGTPNISLNGEAITRRLRYRRSLALLTFLIVERERMHSRSMLSDLFWPHLDPVAGRTNLRQVISDLRSLFKQAQNDALNVTRAGIGLFLNPGLYVDVVAIEHACKEPATSLPASPEHCVSRLYRGPMLDLGGDEAQSPGFSAWLEIHRQGFLLSVVGLVERLRDLALKQNDRTQALMYAQRLVEIEPSRESAHQQLIRLLAESGQIDTAIRQYERLKAQLKTQLDTEPGLEIRALVRDIREAHRQDTPARNEPVPPTTSGANRERRLLSCLYYEFQPGQQKDTDEEQLLETLIGLRDDSANIVREHRGFVREQNGPGVFAYFGFPKALEHAPKLAIRAALKIRARVPNDMQIRIGIHSGSLLVDLEQGVPDVFGQTSGLAMRLRLIGEPDDITVDQATYLAARRDFSFESQGVCEPGGESRAIPTWRVASSELFRPACLPRAPNLAGREGQLQQLLSIWQETRQGSTKVVLIEGPAGIGKTRLSDAFMEMVHLDGASTRKLNGLPEFESSPLAPIKRLIEQQAGIRDIDQPSLRTERLQRWLDQRLPQTDARQREMLMDILHRSDPSQTKPRAQVRALFQLVVENVRLDASRQPMVCLFEDMHWFDKTTLGLLRDLLASIHGTKLPIMLIWTRRSGSEDLNLPPPDHQIRLEPLPLAATEQMLAELDEGAEFSSLDRRQLADRSAGIPLLIEELYHYRKNRTATPPTTACDTDLPASLVLVFQAKIDELTYCKPVLLTASALGQQFREEVLAGLVSPSEHPLNVVLALLCQHNLLRFSDGFYHFRHEMIRETAYRMLPDRRRQKLHQKIAEFLIQDQCSRDDTPELIAYHFEQAGDSRTAIRWWFHAGQLAMRQQADMDAHAHLERAYHLAGTHPPPDDLLISLTLDYSESIISVEGYGASQARDLLEKALSLAERHHERHAQFRALNGIWLLDSSSPEAPEKSLRSAHRLLQLAQDEQQRMTAHFAIGASSLWCGAFDTTVEHLQYAASDGPLDDADERGLMVDRPGGSARAILGWALWFIDRPEDAIAVYEASLAEANRLRQKRLVCYTLAFGCNLLRCLGDVTATRKAARQLLRHSTHSRKYPLWRDLGLLMQCWADAHDPAIQQNWGELLPSMEQLDQRYEKTGGRRILLGIMVEIHIALNDDASALRTLELAVTHLRDMQCDFFASEIYRLRAACRARLGTGRPEQIEADLNRAIGLARAQNTPPLLRRALASHARWLAGRTDLLDPGELLAKVRAERAQRTQKVRQD